MMVHLVWLCDLSKQVCNVLVRTGELEKHIENCPPVLPCGAQPTFRHQLKHSPVQQQTCIETKMHLEKERTLQSVSDPDLAYENELISKMQQMAVRGELPLPQGPKTQTTGAATETSTEQNTRQNDVQQQLSASSESKFLRRQANNAQPKRTARAARAQIAQSQVHQPASHQLASVASQHPIVAFGSALNMSGLDIQVDLHSITGREPRNNVSSIRGAKPSIAMSLEKELEKALKTKIQIKNGIGMY